MSNILVQKLKYVHFVLNEKVASLHEKHAHNRIEELKRKIMRFNDMGCFGKSWECVHFDKECVCYCETCPMQKLNEAYVGALCSWNRAKRALCETNNLVNGMRKDMGIRKIR